MTILASVVTTFCYGQSSLAAPQSLQERQAAVDCMTIQMNQFRQARAYEIMQNEDLNTMNNLEKRQYLEPQNKDLLQMAASCHFNPRANSEASEAWMIDLASGILK